jgi:UPF0042 nucleotide-binding protein
VTKARPRRAAKRDREVSRFLVVTGLSGAGKSHAIHALEDLGYFCVDNLPIALIPTFADLVVASPDIERAAVVVDVREGGQLAAFPRVYAGLQRRPELDVQLLFLEAEQTMLLRRFNETRRPHPLAPDRSAAEGVREERRRLMPIRKLADCIVDTSKLSVHELRRVVGRFAGGLGSPQLLTANLVSFGFRRGVPHDADLMFDVRFLDNPHFVRRLRPLSGLDPSVSRYVMSTAPAREFLKRTFDLLRFLVPHYIEEGKTYLTIAIGCTGGRHRSVAMTEALAKRMRALKGLQIRVQHRDVLEGQRREG